MLKVFQNKITSYLMWFIIISVIISPFLATIYYSVPSTDDFTYAVNLRQSNLPLFNSIIYSTNHAYLTWTGTWPYTFLQYLLNPLNYFEAHSNMYGVTMDFIFIFFTISLCFCVYCIIRQIFDVSDLHITFINVCLFLLLFLNTYNYPTIFYWFIGSIYSIECSFILICIGLTLRLFRLKFSWVNYFALIIVGFISCFSYQLAILPGCFNIIEIVNYSLRHKKINPYMIIPLIIMIIGGCISCFSPGNFSRHATMDTSGLHFDLAIVWGFKNFIFIIKFLYSNYFFVFISVVILLMGFKFFNSQKYSMMNFLVSLLTGIICTFMIFFVVALGYSSDLIYNSTLFYASLTYSLCWFLSLLYFGNYLSNRLVENFNNRLIIKCILCILAASFIVFSFLPSRNLTKNNVELIPSIYNVENFEKVKNESSIYKNVMIELQSDDNNDIIYNTNKLNLQENTSYVIRPFFWGMKNDPSYFNNVKLAMFYNKESIKFLYDDSVNDMYSFCSHYLYLF